MITRGYRPWNNASTTVDIYLLVKNGNNIEVKCKVCQTFFISHLAVLRPTLDHWQGGSFTQPMLIRTLFQVWPEDHLEPRNEIGSQTLTSALVGFEPETFRFWVSRAIPLCHFPRKCASRNNWLSYCWCLLYVCVYFICHQS